MNNNTAANGNDIGEMPRNYTNADSSRRTSRETSAGTSGSVGDTVVNASPQNDTRIRVCDGNTGVAEDCLSKKALLINTVGCLPTSTSNPIPIMIDAENRQVSKNESSACLMDESFFLYANYDMHLSSETHHPVHSLNIARPRPLDPAKHLDSNPLRPTTTVGKWTEKVDNEDGQVSQSYYETLCSWTGENETKADCTQNPLVTKSAISCFKEGPSGETTAAPIISCKAMPTSSFKPSHTTPGKVTSTTLSNLNDQLHHDYFQYKQHQMESYASGNHSALMQPELRKKHDLQFTSKVEDICSRGLLV